MSSDQFPKNPLLDSYFWKSISDPYLFWSHKEKGQWSNSPISTGRPKVLSFRYPIRTSKFTLHTSNLVHKYRWRSAWSLRDHRIKGQRPNYYFRKHCLFSLKGLVHDLSWKPCFSLSLFFVVDVLNASLGVFYVQRKESQLLERYRARSQFFVM